MNYLLDTCVISELVAKQPNERVVQWVDNIEVVGSLPQCDYHRRDSQGDFRDCPIHAAEPNWRIGSISSS